ncbi:MAG: NAD(P)/FAD-dependent oxidoreductase [Bacteroidia bacterium]|nr:NAD(P)/FAD-dependent oxidoreductase [Bacteroidia bacterium]
MEKYDVLIIGAGLGGLQCGYILANHGMRVCILEQDALLGGCLQTYRRAGLPLDTGFHYIGGLDEGQVLHKLFKYFNLLDLPWVRMDNDCADLIIINGKEYRIPQGYDNYAAALKSYFPNQASGIDEWVNMMRQVGEGIFHSLEPRSAESVFSQSLFARGAYEYLSSIISDPLLIDVISGPALKMELNAEKLPLYTFAQINSSFVQSAYRIKGGGMQIAERLRKGIESKGGVVRRNAKVTQILGAEGHASSVEVNGGEYIVEADHFISDIHPSATMSLMEESGLVRKIYRKRIYGLKNTYGMFTASLVLKENAVKYQNNNIYVYRNANLWHLPDNLNPQSRVDGALISFVPADKGDATYTRNIDILTPMDWSTVEKWFGTKVACRGDEYNELKRIVAQNCIDLAAECIPGLKEAILEVHTSTPLTYTDYTATAQGSAYGIQKDFNNLMFTLLTPRTPVDNLLLTGQSLNLHGILGTSMTSLFTCAELVGAEPLSDILKK